MSRVLGLAAEEIAAEYLKRLGYKIVKQNYFASVGEVDIIAVQDEVWCFVEVKYRHNKGFGSAADTITKSKINKILKSAKLYLFNNSLVNVDFRIDAVLIDADTGSIELIENVFCEGLL